MIGRLHHPAGTLASGDAEVALTADDAGWAYSGLTVVALVPATQWRLELVGMEAVVLPIAALDVHVAIDGQVFELHGRTSVFASVSDFVYCPRGSTVSLTCAAGGEVAIATARCDRRTEARYGAARDVAVEIRGAGPATRQVNDFLGPDTFPYADKLMCVELLTPDGNWSSYPPHRHDDSPDCPVNNEEIYYFRIGTVGSTTCSRDGFGMHRTYTPDGEIDENVVVRDGDVFCVPRGYHGPCIAAPGYPMYYLNVLAGPGGERSMAFCDDPAHHWVRDTWSDMPLDPRCPMTSAAGLAGVPA